MFGFLKAGIERITNTMRRVLGIEQRSRFDKPTKVDPRAIQRRVPLKHLLPRTCFTKKGPGVVAATRRALAGMRRWERLYCKAMGWDRGLVREDGRMK